jgi:rare lipoprotein A
MQVDTKIYSYLLREILRRRKMFDHCNCFRRAVRIALLLFLAGYTVVGATETQTGRASWYSTKECNNLTASGKPLNDKALTAAHKKLPLGTVVRVTNLVNNKSVVVTIIDRGPYKRGRIIDLTRSAFAEIAPLDTGIAKIQITVIKFGKGRVVNRS